MTPGAPRGATGAAASCCAGVPPARGRRGGRLITPPERPPPRPAARQAWNPPSRSVALTSPKLLQRHRGQARRVPLVAHHDHGAVVVARLGNAEPARGRGAIRARCGRRAPPGISPSRRRCSTGRVSTRSAPRSAAAAASTAVTRRRRDRAASSSSSTVVTAQASHTRMCRVNERSALVERGVGRLAPGVVHRSHHPAAASSTKPYRFRIVRSAVAKNRESITTPMTRITIIVAYMKS